MKSVCWDVTTPTVHFKKGRRALLHQPAGHSAGVFPRVIHSHVVHDERVRQLQRVPQLLLVGRDVPRPRAVHRGLRWDIILQQLWLGPACLSNVSRQMCQKHICTLSCWREELKGSGRQEVRNVCEENRKWDALKAVTCVFQEMGTDQGVTRVRPVEFKGHVELGDGLAAEHQPLPGSQPGLRRGQGEIMDLVSCGKGRPEVGVSRRPIVLLRLQSLTLSPTQAEPWMYTFPTHGCSIKTQLLAATADHFRWASSLTDNSNYVERGLKGLISNLSLAGHDPGVADQMAGNRETPLGVPQRLLPIRMKLLVWILLTDTEM